jgi:hypothetical protein
VFLRGFREDEAVEVLHALWRLAMLEDATALFAGIGVNEDGRSALGVYLFADEFPDGFADSADG